MERNPKQPGMYKNPVNNGINYQPQLVEFTRLQPSTGYHCLPDARFDRPKSQGISQRRWDSKHVFWLQISDTWWFKVTFLSPSWRSLNLSKRSLNHPEKGTLNHQVPKLFHIRHEKNSGILGEGGRLQVSDIHRKQSCKFPHSYLTRRILECGFFNVASTNFKWCFGTSATGRIS